MKLKKEAMEALGAGWKATRSKEAPGRGKTEKQRKKRKKKRGTERKKEPKGMTRYKKETRVVNVADDAGKMQE